MHISITRDDEWLRVDAHLGEGDTPVVRPGAMAHGDARIRLDKTVKVHPDVLALAGVLIFEPWSKAFTFDFGVSSHFALAAQDAGLSVGPVDEALSPRDRPDGAPGLCYSGGADCTAALAVMPVNTLSYFLDRVARPGVPWRGLYRKAAAHHACEKLSAAGRTVRMVETDLEFVREPVGFPHDFANAVPLLMYAEEDNLSSVSWGAILESTYRVGALKFRDYTKSPWFTGVGSLFNAVGLPVYNPVAGVSEVGTALIASASPLGEFAQSCMRGDVGEPCMRCWKCARKSLLDAALTGMWPSGRDIDAMAAASDTPRLFAKEPLKHEGVVAYFASRYPDELDSHFMQLLKARVKGYPSDHFARYYAPSLDTFPADLRGPTEVLLNDFLEPMSSVERELVADWDLRALLATERRKRDTEAFLVYLRQIVADAGRGNLKL